MNLVCTQQLSTQSLTKRLYLIIVFLVVAAQFSSDVVNPSFPAIKDYFNAEPLSFQAVVTAYLLGSGGCHLISGILSDHYGRKIVLLYGIGIFTVFSLCSAFCSNIYQLIFFRFMQGLGVGVCAVLSKAILRDVVAEDDFSKVSSILMQISAIIPTIAIILGGYLQYYFQWRSNFIFLFLLGIMVIISIGVVYRETNVLCKTEKMKSLDSFKACLKIFKDKNFIYYALKSSLSISVIHIYTIIAPFLFQRSFMMSSIQYGWLGFVGTFSVLLGGGMNVVIVKRIGCVESAKLAGKFLLVGSGLLLLLPIIFANNLYTILIPMVIITASALCISINSMSLSYKNIKRDIGTASGLFTLIQVLILSVVGLSLSILLGYTLLCLSVYSCIVSIVVNFWDIETAQKLKQLFYGN